MMHSAESFLDFQFAYAVRVKAAQIQIPSILLLRETINLSNTFLMSACQKNIAMPINL
jgi:hypothetical protein